MGSASVVVIVVFLGQWVAGWVCCLGFFLGVDGKLWVVTGGGGGGVKCVVRRWW